MRRFIYIHFLVAITLFSSCTIKGGALTFSQNPIYFTGEKQTAEVTSSVNKMDVYLLILDGERYNEPQQGAFNGRDNVEDASRAYSYSFSVEWLSFSYDNDTGSARITVDTNTSGNTRTAEIRVSSGSYFGYLNIIQEPIE